MSTGLTFNAIDVETANADRASICQIGIVHVHDGNILDEWKTLLDPEDWFDSWNVAIHGIDERAVRGAPTLPQVRDDLCRRLHDSVLVSHTAFDRTAFERAMNRYELEQLQVTWLDSARIVRRVWPDRYASRGWGLKKVARDLKIAFTPLDALEDARAAAQVVCHASAASGLGVEAPKGRGANCGWTGSQDSLGKRLSRNTQTGGRLWRIFVVRTNDGLIVKRAGKSRSGNWQLASDNPDKQDWPTRRWPASAEVIGEVTWAARTF